MVEAGSTSYDGFLSYSHAADDLLAPRLQAGLQRFAKPWWKRRALRVFRDEASLSANPHLWSSITDALDDSGWFVLLLSPEAASSEWVNREIDYWREHKDPQKILPVVTDGEFGWAGGDVAGDAAPPSLQGVFADEPRWVDLRFARTESQLNLRHGRFRDALADIAATVRGVPKDELESEEVRQHRRTVRTAWTAGIAILALSVAATVGAVVAYNAQQDAEGNAGLAQEERDRAVAAEQSATEERDRAISAEEEAERQRNVAEQERERAEANAAAEVLAARESRARELAAAALLNLDFDPERSILLAIEAVETADSAERPDLQEPIVALRKAVAASRVVSRIDSGWFVAYSPDGSLIAGSDGGEGVDTAIWDAETGEQIHVLAAPEGRWMYNPTFSPDGRHLVVPYEPMDSETDHAGPVAVVWDVVTGEPVATFGGPDVGVSAIFATFNPDGTMLAVNTDESSDWVAAAATPGSLVVWDMASGTERYRIAHAEAHSPRHSFSPDGTMLALPAISDDPLLPSRVVLHDALTGMEINSFDVGELRPPTTAFDPSGRRLAALSDWPPGLMIWDIASGETVLSMTLEGQQSEMAWSPDGDLIAVAGTEGVPRLLDAATGDEVLFLLGHDSAIYSLAFSPDGERLAAAAEDADTLVWDITASGSREVATLATPYSDLGKMRYDADGNNLLVMTVSPAFVGSLLQLDATTGEVMAEIPDQRTGYPLQVRLVPEAGLVATLNVDGIAALHDSQTFEPVATLPEGYFALDVSRDGTRVVLRRLDTGEAMVAEVGSWKTLTTDLEGTTWYARFSPDGNLVTGYNAFVFDIETQTYLATRDTFPMIPAVWSPDGSFIAARTRGGRLGLVEVAALRDGATPEEALVFDIDAHDGLIQDPVHFNRDGSLIATWGNIDRHLKVWSTEDGQLVADLGERDWSGFDFHPNGRHLVTGGPDGTIRVLTLDTNELIDIARSRLTRGFTDDECATYRIDPCPDPETIRGG